jgi:hypothetical protein
MTVPAYAQLLSNVAANVTGAWVFWQGGIATFQALAAAFGGGTITLQTLGPDQATPVAVGSSTTVTANAIVEGLNLPAGVYRCTLTGATSPSGVYASLAGSLD